MRHLAGIAVLIAIIAGSSAFRIVIALDDPNFDAENPAPLLKTDPALLYYITERIIESGGFPPADFRADPRLEYPDLTDIPTAFTVGQEFVLAWAYLAFGGDTPLHVFSLWLMAVFASGVAVGVYGLTLEITRSVRWACLAALLWAVLLANYRTVGAILIREDFGFPWFALFLYLLARAARVKSIGAFVLAGLALVATVATWHAVNFVVLMGMACVLLLFLRTGENLLAKGYAGVVPLVALIGGWVVPVLRAKQFGLSLPMLMAAALWGAGRGARRFGWSRGVETIWVLGSILVLVAGASGIAHWSGAGLSDYSHVFELLIAKVRFLGSLPEDPARLSFGARLLWEGPFETAQFEYFTGGFTAALLALVAVFTFHLPEWLRGTGEPRRMLLVAFAGIALVAAILIQRTELVLGFAAPVAIAASFELLRPRSLGIALMALTIAIPAAVLATLPTPIENPWYLPPERNQELADMKEWVARNIPADAPIAADFLTSAAILSHTGNPILQQPKYETVRSRQRIEEFYRAFFFGTPEQLHAHLVDLGASYLVVDRHFLLGEIYIAGIKPSEFDTRVETAAWLLLSQRPKDFARVPGFRLLYRSPQNLVHDSYRIYALE